MDLELGLKISHTTDDLTSSSDFRIAKNKSAPVFISNETETSFILTAHLKGYKKEHVDIDINEEGTQLGITVEKPVHEKVMSGWSMKSKEGETRGFRKVFRIPDGVVLSRIKAKFNDQDSTLKIFMPKVVKGVVGVGVKELQEEGVIIGRPQMTEAATDEVPETEKMRMKKNSQAKGKEVEKETYTKEIVLDDQELQTKDPRETKGGGMESEESKEQKIAENKEADRIEREDAERRSKEETHGGVKNDKSTEATHRVAKPSQEIEETETRIEEPANSNEMPEAMPEKKKLLDKCECSEMGKGKDVGEKSTAEKKLAASEKSKLLSTPLIIAGSALLVSIVLLAIYRIRNRKK
ncbi:PREDICTED: uncharacterized protein LOC101294229 [Fragaria vesca subsp. vesca]|uniref:uncharacterized protein LOC101294229 n=1 Tax=Fragaria vesca subsp. vesca TaxID=101020 RepID=UPI0002C357DB|nr:PREDICTED: uncharacterized protein LOC101294229 [Fragaria vesca subsp. vesca]